MEGRKPTTGPKEKDASAWNMRISTLARCTSSALEALRDTTQVERTKSRATKSRNEVACSGLHQKVVLFSDSIWLKQLGQKQGFTVTKVQPMHSASSALSEDQLLQTVAEIHALADASVILAGSAYVRGKPHRSGFADFAIELGLLRSKRGVPLETFNINFLNLARLDICQDVRQQALRHSAERQLIEVTHRSRRVHNFFEAVHRRPVESGKCVSLDENSTTVHSTKSAANRTEQTHSTN